MMKTTNQPRRVAGSRLSIRARLLIGMLLLTGLTLLIAGTVNYVLERKNLDARMDSSLSRDVEEVRVLADSGIDPETQQHFTNATDLMYMAMQYNQLSETQSMLGMQHGDIAWSAPSNVLLRLEEDPEFVRWAADLRPDSAYLTTLHTEQSTYRVAVVPIQLAEDDSPGVFIEAFDAQAERHELWVSAATFIGAGTGAILIGCIAAWLLVGRMLQPVRDLQEAAHRISEQDLDSRIQARGHDEFAELTETINNMLDRLQQALEQQRQLLDDVGHELRTPITIIRGHLELMDLDDLDDIRQTQDIGLDELHRMSLLVSDLVTLAQSNRTDFVQPAPTDIDALMRDIATKAEALGPRTWTLNAHAQATVAVDSARLTQAMLQLCANAVKFSDPGSAVELGSAIRRSGTDATQLCLWVTDTGFGIEPVDQQRIFERFGRGGNGDRAQGSGLGLNIVAAIAAAHGGGVHLESTPGEGSTFSIHIPLEPTEGSRHSADITHTLETAKTSDQESDRE